MYLKRLCQIISMLIINTLFFIFTNNCSHPVQELSGFDTVALPTLYLKCSVSNYYLAGTFVEVRS
jgi:hypothetical protein